MNIQQEKYCGLITIVGKPNVGKSTLINHIIGHKISIVSRKKNTTQTNITGIKTETFYQFVYIDTPGVLFDKKDAFIKKHDNSQKIVKNSSLIIFIIDRVFWTQYDEKILNNIRQSNIPIIVIINKIDKISDKNILLPYIKTLKNKINFLGILPISVKNIKDIALLEKIIKRYLPKNPHLYSQYEITTNSQCFTISEIIREQLIVRLGDELPSIIEVKVESLKKEIKEIHIRSNIYVKNIQQKKIIIGKNGKKIKIISIISRYHLEKQFHTTVHLNLWVKVKYSKQ